MSDFVLRGYCKNPLCNKVIYFPNNFEGEPKFNSRHKEEIEKKTITGNTTKIWKNVNCEPVWLLSANQMERIWLSPIFTKWQKEYDYASPFNAIQRMLKDFPFLVAKILKESEKK